MNYRRVGNIVFDLLVDIIFEKKNKYSGIIHVVLGMIS